MWWRAPGRARRPPRTARRRRPPEPGQRRPPTEGPRTTSEGERSEFLGLPEGLVERAVRRQQVFVRHVQVQLRQRVLARRAAQRDALPGLSQTVRGAGA